MSESTNLDRQELEGTTPPKTPKKKWLWTGAVILAVVATIAVAALIANLAGGKTPAQPTDAAGHSHGNQSQEAESNSYGIPDTSDVNPQAKDLIEMQHRRDPGDPRALGKVDAPVIVELYSDFQCGHCANFAMNTLTKVADLIEDGTVRIEFNNFPVLGDASILAAQAAVAAGEQDKFWEFHDYLYQNLLANTPVEYTAEGLTAAAEKIGVEDLARFQEDMEKAAQTVQQEQGNALQNLRLEGTPSMFVGYLFSGGSIPEDVFRQAVAQELERYQ
ncbi:MAG: thioredoxin domain-containing protein [Trueperella sp.]|nr:thioredoxin domain-containing protein [Trueperella sp.]